MASNLYVGHKEAIPQSVPFEKGDIRDTAFLDRVFTTHKPDAIMVYTCNLCIYVHDELCLAFLCFD